MDTVTKKFNQMFAISWNCSMKKNSVCFSFSTRLKMMRIHAADFESYSISTMRDSGEWGGNLELVAAARLYQ
jgi:hypothetical protein